MTKDQSKKTPFSDLTKKELDLIKTELVLIEQKTLHLENLQYRLRQFSITLWIATLGLGLGITINKPANIFLLVVSFFIPGLFLFLDAWYARNAQRLRARRNTITHYLNFEDPSLMAEIEKNLNAQGLPTKFPILDLTGELTVSNNPQTEYRASILVKLTRIIRIVFYGFQLLGSSIMISNFLATSRDNFLYYLLVLIVPFFTTILFFSRNILKKKILRLLPPVYYKNVDEFADKPSNKRSETIKEILVRRI